MRLSLRQKSRLTTGIFVAGVALCMVACIFNDRILWPPLWAGMGLLVVAVVLEVKWWRCPQCRTSLGRNFNPKFCPNCGAEIDYDAT